MSRPTPTPSVPGGPLSRFLIDPDDYFSDLIRAAKRLLGAVLPWGVRALILVAILTVVTLAFKRVRSRRQTRKGVRLRILPPAEVNPDGADVLWMGLHALIRPWWKRALLGQPHLAWEVTDYGGNPDLSLWVPDDFSRDLVARAIESAWPGARTERMDRTLLPSSKYVATTKLGLLEPDRFPIGEGIGDDPLRLVLGALNLVVPGEAAVIQIVARPVTVAGRRRLRRDARDIRRQRNALTMHKGQRRPAGPIDIAADADARSVLLKAGSPLWETSVRIAVMSKDSRARRGKIHALAGAFAVFDGRNAFTRRRMLFGAQTIERRRFGGGYLLSAPELARIATLPSAAALPALERARARTVAPPRDIPETGVVLGVSDHPGYAKLVAISHADAAHHIHLIGETGSGKSTLIARMVLADAENGRGAVVIDPKGDLVNDIVRRLPEEAIARTCLLDPTDRKNVVGFNVLACDGEDPDLVADNTNGIFKRLFEHHWGPRSDDFMRAACLTLTQVPGATLAEVGSLLQSREWVRQIRAAATLKDVHQVNAFWDSYEAQSDKERDQAIAPLMNKLRQFVLRTKLLEVVGQRDPKLDISKLIESGGILLVRIPKGEIGEETSKLLGAFIVARVWQSVMKRAAMPEEWRQPVGLYVDEMHNFLALPRSFEDVLAEARAYRLSLVLAHQHLGQLPRGMKEALGANARTKIAFTCSPEDAIVLERHFAPSISAHDIANLDTYQAVCKPIVDGGRRPPFTFRTEPLTAPPPEREKEVKAASARAFAHSRKAVKAEIRSRHKQIQDMDKVGPRAATYRRLDEEFE